MQNDQRSKKPASQGGDFHLQGMGLGHNSNHSYKTEESHPDTVDFGPSVQCTEYLDQVRKWSKAYVGHFKRAYSGNSLRAAVTSKCLDCTCCQRVEVKKCPVISCPLWEYRPYK
jgi:hypothetical protein